MDIREILAILKKIGISSPAGVPHIGTIYALLRSELTSEKQTEILIGLKKLTETEYETLSEELQATREQIVRLVLLFEKALLISMQQPSDMGRIVFPYPLSLHNQTSPEPNFVGRTEILTTLTEWWHSDAVHVGSLIGWGGMGKSALVRKWYEDLDKNNIQHDGVFWWGFYRNANLDLFLNALLDFAKGGSIYPDDVKSNWEKVEKIKRYLQSGTFLVILDGFETMQKNQASGEFGAAAHLECKELLTSLVDFKEGTGLCLITTRYPLWDLINWKGGAFQQQEVQKLSLKETKSLFYKIGVKKTDEEIAAVWEGLEGHALSLRLLIGYLVEGYSIDIGRAIDILSYDSHDEVGGRAHRMLCWYNAQLKEEQRTFMKIFSSFRTNVTEDDFECIFRQPIKRYHKVINRSLTLMEPFHFKNMVKNLCDRRLVSLDTDGSYTTHPLVKNYFESVFDVQERKLVHKYIYYRIGKYAPEKPETLEEMQPLFEQVYHGCRAGMYKNAFRDIYMRIVQQQITAKESHRFLTYNLSAWNTNLSLVKEFFPQGNPKVTAYLPKEQIMLINEVALSTRMVGKPNEAETLYKISLENAISQNNLIEVSLVNHNLMDLQIIMGQLTEALISGWEAIKLIREVKNTICRYPQEGIIWQEHNSMAYHAYASFLSGDVDAATVEFENANKLKRTTDSFTKYLYNVRGIFYTDLLLAQDKIEEAIEVATENSRICHKKNWIDAINFCLRSFASIHRCLQEYAKAEEEASQAILGAKKTGTVEVEIQGLLELSRIKLDMKEYKNAIQYANKVLKFINNVGFKLYESDAEIVLGKAYLALEDLDKAESFASSAYQKAINMNYRWPEGDSAHLLGEICLTMGDKVEAREWLEKAVACRKKISDPKVQQSEMILKCS